MGQRNGVKFSSGQLPFEIFVVDMLAPFDLKRFGVFSASFGNIQPLIRERAAHAAKHAAIDNITNGRFHHTPSRRRGKKHRLLCCE